jgi:hypothetical protein
LEADGQPEPAGRELQAGQGVDGREVRARRVVNLPAGHNRVIFDDHQNGLRIPSTFHE